MYLLNSLLILSVFSSVCVALRDAFDVAYCDSSSNEFLSFSTFLLLLFKTKAQFTHLSLPKSRIEHYLMLSELTVRANFYLQRKEKIVIFSNKNYYF